MLVMALISGCTTGRSPGGEPIAEARTYVFNNWSGPSLRVEAAIPSSLSDKTNVVFVMHGVSRNAGDYRNAWLEIAESCDVLVLSPRFSQSDFPGSAGYNFGGLAVLDEGSRAFDAIELLFEDAVRRFGLADETYAIFGHSAGAQFVHRFLMFTPNTRVSHAVAANAGWYTLPDHSESWPYGLRDAPAPPLPASAILDQPVTLLLGEMDIDSHDPNLRRTPEALRQGSNRFERGLTMMIHIESLSASEDIETAWEAGFVPGVGHDNGRMAPAALRYLLDPDRLALPRCSGIANGTGND